LKKWCFIFLLNFIFFSCGKENMQLTMPEKDLIKLLYDIQVAEAIVNNLE